MDTQKPNIAYFGGEPLGVPVLEQLEKAGIAPTLVVCNPDRPVGRKQTLTAPAVKQWALEHNIEVFQPEDLNNSPALCQLTDIDWDLFLVVAYNQIMPKSIIDLPKHGSLNVHPSLLPLLRGASPIRSAILQDMQTTGVSLMLLDEKMDHGPLLAQKEITIPENQWPISGTELDSLLAHEGGALLAQTIPQWLSGEITPQEQNHENATYCSKLTRDMGELTIDPNNLPTDDEAYQTLLKIRAFDVFPGTFFMHEGKRIKINDAQLTEGQLRVVTVTPEGKNSTLFTTWLETIS